MNELAQSSLAASALYSRERQASRMMQVLVHVTSGRGSRVWQALEEKQ